MGEGMPTDAAIMAYISSANIACGAHAGDAATMQRTIDLAVQHNVAIGAHPGFRDNVNFGRMERQLTVEMYYELISEQLFTLQQYIDAAGAVMHHIKPHGALYNMSAKDNAVAAIIAKATADHNPALVLYGLCNSHSITAAKEAGLQTASEVFADRTYMDDGSLTPRSNSNALITDDIKSVQQVLQMLQQQTVTAVNGKIIPVSAETICIHGDGTHAISFAKLLSETIQKQQIKIHAK